MEVVFGVEDSNDVISGVRQGAIERVRLVDRPGVEYHEGDVFLPLPSQRIDFFLGFADGPTVVCGAHHQYLNQFRRVIRTRDSPHSGLDD